MIFRSVREWSYLEVEQPGPGAFSRDLADRIVATASEARNGGFEGENVLVNHPKRLRAQQIVGMVAAEGVTVEILPKIDGAESDADARKSLVHMLSLVLDLDIAEGSITDLGWQKESLLEILIRLFCDKLFEAVHRGLPRRYVERSDDLAALRGRLDPIRQFTANAASPQRIACQFDDLSEDIPLNQIMKAAILRMLRLSRSAENQRRLAELSLAFADVRQLPVRALPWSQVLINRTNRTWGELLNMAKLLLGERFQTTSRGSQRGFALLFEMNTLFEEFVGRTLRKALANTPYEVRLQGPRSYALTDLDTLSDRFATKPDISIIQGDKTLMIADTKWKRLTGALDDPKRGVSQADVYQMMAYAHVYETQRLMLLYPHHETLADREGVLGQHLINGSVDTKILTATLSLAKTQDVVGRLRELILPILSQVLAGSKQRVG